MEETLQAGRRHGVCGQARVRGPPSALGPADAQGSPQLAAAAPARKPPRPADPSFPRGMAVLCSLVLGQKLPLSEGLGAPYLWRLKVAESSPKPSRWQEVEDGSPPISFSATSWHLECEK